MEGKKKTQPPFWVELCFPPTFTSQSPNPQNFMMWSDSGTGSLQMVSLKITLQYGGSYERVNSSVQVSHSVMSDSLQLYDCSTPGFPVHHQHPKFTPTHIHWVGDAIQPSHPLSSPSPPVFNLSQHQGLFKWVSSLHQMAKVLEFQLQHQSFQWIFRTDFL